MNPSARLSRARLTDLPQPATREDYRRAEDEILDRLAALPGLVAIYRTGSVSVPGISDLDDIAVVDPAVDSVPSVWEGLSTRTRYLAMHSPFLIDTDSFRKLRWFAHAEPLDHVTGDSIELEPPPDLEHSAMLMAAEGLVTALLQQIKQAATGRFKVRQSLCSLHSLRHDMDLAGLPPGSIPDARAMVERVADVRRAWFAERPDIRALLPRVIPAIHQAIDAMPEQLPVEMSRSAKRLAWPWSRVRLEPSPDGRTEVRVRAPLVGMSLGGRIRRGAEAAWRLGEARLRIPPQVFGLLAGDEVTEFRQHRTTVVRAYRTFLRVRASDHSMLGYAGPFIGD